MEVGATGADVFLEGCGEEGLAGWLEGNSDTLFFGICVLISDLAGVTRIMEGSIAEDRLFDEEDDLYPGIAGIADGSAALALALRLRNNPLNLSMLFLKSFYKFLSCWQNLLEEKR